MKDEEDYRPPVPPHRNIGITANGSLSELTPPKKLHHHHHNRNKGQDKLGHHRLSSDTSRTSSRPSSGLGRDTKDEVDKKECHIFEFDDEPHEVPKKEEKIEFVQYPKSPNANCKYKCLTTLSGSSNKSISKVFSITYYFFIELANMCLHMNKTFFLNYNYDDKLF